MTIAVTGPYASGKSTFVQMLGDLGAETVSADEIVHHRLSEDEEAIQRVAERFGETVRGGRGIDRKALGRVVFGDPEALRDLEDILHPLVRKETDRRISASEAGVFVAEIPLLFEGGRGGAFDCTVAVTAPGERRLAWAAERGLDEAALQAIEARQLSGEEKARRADVVVENGADLVTLRGRAEELLERVSGGRGPGGGRRNQAE